MKSGRLRTQQNIKQVLLELKNKAEGERGPRIGRDQEFLIQE
jgi:hypothetical protein